MVWINVNDSYPEPIKDNWGFVVYPHVLIFAPHHDIEFTVGYYDTEDDVWREAQLDTELDYIQWWMTLHQPPTEPESEA